MTWPNNFDREAVLTDPSFPTVYSSLSRLAHEFAFLGDVKTARNLTSLLLSEDEDSLNHIRPEIESFAGPEYRYDGWSKTEKLDLLMRSFSYDQFSNSSLAGPAAPRAGSLGDALAIAIEMAAEHESSGKDPEHDGNVQRVLSVIIDNLLNLKIIIRSLVQHRNIWPILCSGALARTLRIDTTKLKQFADTVLDTFIERLKKGRRPLITESKPIGELVSIIEQNNKTSGVTFYEEYGVDIPEVFHVLPGATDTQTSASESSLGVSLPDNYKEFLKYSNGFGDMFNGYFMNPQLFGIDAVTRSDTQYANILPIDLQDYPHGLFPFSRAMGCKWDDWPRYNKALSLGSKDVDDIWFLPPSETKSTLEAYAEAMNHPQVPKEVKAITKKLVISRYGSWEEFMKLEWVVMRIFDTEHTAFGSF